MTPELPTSPAHLSDAERDVWAATAPLVAGDWTPAQLGTLEAYCVERARWLAADAFVRAHGDVLVLRNEKGDVVGSKEAPQLRIARSARDTALRLAGRLGLATDDEGDGNRDGLGRFRRGNLIAVRHALDSERLPPEFQHLRAEVEEFVSSCLVDEGDAAAVPRRRRGMLEYRARLHRRILQLDAAIELRGLFDARGKLREKWVQRLEGLISSARAIDSLLGLDRRAKTVPTLRDYLEARAHTSAGAVAPGAPGASPAAATEDR